jgi:hypothetical protein
MSGFFSAMFHDLSAAVGGKPKSDDMVLIVAGIRVLNSTKFIWSLRPLNVNDPNSNRLILNYVQDDIHMEVASKIRNIYLSRLNKSAPQNSEEYTCSYVPCQFF